jgi:hypothetical protein
VVRVADRLCSELGCPEGGNEIASPAAAPRGGEAAGISGVLTSDDESLVATMRQSLARIAAAAGAGTRGEAAEDDVAAALDVAERVTRGELVSGNAKQLASLMPSFVFLVTLPIVDHDEALDLSRRASQLIEEG